MIDSVAVVASLKSSSPKRNIVVLLYLGPTFKGLLQMLLHVDSGMDKTSQCFCLLSECLHLCVCHRWGKKCNLGGPRPDVPARLDHIRNICLPFVQYHLLISQYVVYILIRCCLFSFRPTFGCSAMFYA